MSKLNGTEARNWALDTQKEKPLFAKPVIGIIALVFLALIDLFNFLEGVMNHLNSQDVFSMLGPYSSLTIKMPAILTLISSVIMVFGFVAAFEIATIYMAYAFSLKLYGYDRCALRISKKTDKDNNRDNHSNNKNRFKLSKFISTTSLGWFAFFVFVLGVIANIIFRIGLMKENDCFVVNDDGKIKYFEIAMNIVLIILPIVTSVLNFVIGCFTFDPLLFKMNSISKSIEDYEKQIVDIEVYKKHCEEELNVISSLKEKDNDFLNKSLENLKSFRSSLANEMYNSVIGHLK